MPSKASRRNTKNGYSNHHRLNHNNNNNGRNNNKSLSDLNKMDGEQQKSNFDHELIRNDNINNLLNNSNNQNDQIDDKSLLSQSSHRRHKHRHRHSHSRHKHRHKHHSHKKTSKYWKCLGICKCDKNYFCILISFLISFLMLFGECFIILRSINNNKPPFMSHNINNEEQEDKYDGNIDPNVLYNFNYNEIYKFRDELVSIQNSNELDLVYQQNINEGFIDSDNIIDIHSDQYFQQYQHNKRLLHGITDPVPPPIDDEEEGGSILSHDDDYESVPIYLDSDYVDGYVFRDKQREPLLVFYEYIFSQHALLYMGLKNIFGFAMIILSILSPSTSRKLYVIIFGFCSIINSLLAFTNPNIYLSYTKTSVPFYKKIIYQFYALNNCKILIILAFIQHTIASVIYLKNVSYHHRQNKRKYKKSQRLKIPNCLYTLCLFIGSINFIILVPLGVDWNGYGVIRFSSSSVSFSVGLILLILNQYGFLMDDYQRKKYEKKQAKLAKQQSKMISEQFMKGNGMINMRINGGTEGLKNGNIEFVSAKSGKNIDDISFHHIEHYEFDQTQRNEKNEIILDENGEPKTKKKKAMIIFAQFKNKEISDQYRNGLKAIQQNNDIANIHKINEDDDQKKQIEGVKHKNGINGYSQKHKNGHSKHCQNHHNNHYNQGLRIRTKNGSSSNNNKHKNGTNNNNNSHSLHRRRMKLMDGTVIKCQCNECKQRREKRREERKKVKILKQMINGNGKYSNLNNHFINNHNNDDRK